MINFNAAESLFIKRQEFISVLTGIIGCYQESLTGFSSLEDNEEIIRDKFVYDYLWENEFREKYNLENFIFEAEAKHLGGVSAYIDIKVLNTTNFKNPKKDFFVIECKRLDGGKTLNRKYVDEGINRFVIEEKYASHKGLNAMIGFMVKEFDPSKNLLSMEGIIKSESNQVLASSTLNSEKRFFSNSTIVADFTNSYASNHTLLISQTPLELFHLMFNYASLIPKKEMAKDKKKADHNE